MELGTDNNSSMLIMNIIRAIVWGIWHNYQLRMIIGSEWFAIGCKIQLTVRTGLLKVIKVWDLNS